MSGFFRWFFGFFLSWWGVFLLSALDATPFFYLPLATDFVLILVIAQHPDLFWLFPFLAVTGSLLGTFIAYKVGQEIGEKELERFVPRRKLETIKRKVKEKGAVFMGALAIIPPPFPFTAFAITSGALELSKKKFFPTVALTRFLRFGTETVLVLIYGERIVRWLQSELVRGIVLSFLLVVTVSIAFSTYRIVKMTRSRA